MNKFSELKAAAMAATPGPWGSVYDDWSDGDDALISSESRDGMVAIAKIEGGGPDSGYDEPFGTEQQANTAFIAAANPAVVLELLAELAELEAKDKRIAELEEEFSFIMGQNDGMEKELRDKDARIEHLEAKLFTTPPAPAVPDELLDAMEEVIRISDRDHEAWDEAKAAITACRAAMLAAAPTQGKNNE